PGAISTEPPLEQRRVSVCAAITQEGPIATHFFHAAQVAFGNEDFFLVGGGFGDQLPEWIGHKRRAPEFQPAIRRSFEADAVHRGYEEAVGDGVGALNRAPGIELRRAEFSFFRWMPADGRGIKKNI